MDLKRARVDLKRAGVDLKRAGVDLSERTVVTVPGFEVRQGLEVL